MNSQNKKNQILKCLQITLTKLPFIFAVVSLWSVVQAQPQSPPAMAGKLSEKPGDIPGSIVLPWDYIGINAEEKVTQKKVFQKAHKELVELFIDKSLDLTKTQNFPSRNISRVATRLSYGKNSQKQSESSGQATSLILAPTWCTIGNLNVISFNIFDSLHYLVASSNWLIPNRKNFSIESAMSGFRSEFNQLLSRTRRTTDNPSVFKLQIQNGNNLSRRDTAQGRCLNILLAASIPPEIRIIHQLSSFHNTLVKRALNQQLISSRANRKLNIFWPQTLKIDLKTAIPASYAIYENIFGTTLQRQTPFTITLQEQSGKLLMTNLEAVSNEIKALAAKLKSSDYPQISHIRGGWVYLDRGRAWGLNIRDRLVFEQNGKRIITGHVVRFFGQEMSIKSPRGFVIDDGAIMFVRKGQQEVNIGQTLQFDPLSFPVTH